MHATSKNKTTKRARRKVRFPGIGAAAKALGVNRVTLYRTLTGEWKLPGLLGRYQKLKGGSK